MSEMDQLIRMANQIAENFSFYDDQVARTSDHLQKFWAPPMRQKLMTHAASGGQGLSTAALEAAGKLEH
ncbi:MAG TPA: formate dehydrogenase subunit delta [Xanthomonadales bacterium]|nr:formate dehydrogenase subunit delta [Xanthomonadales bacterium]